MFEGGFWARGLEYELIDDFCYTLIVIRTLGHILRQILVAKIPISHGGESNPRTSNLESSINSKKKTEKLLEIGEERFFSFCFIFLLL